MIVLGIDPGSLRTGWGVVRSEGQRLHAAGLGVIRPGARLPLERRLAAIHAELVSILQSYVPECVAIETVFHGVNTRALITLGEARGVVMAAAGAAAGAGPVRLIELAPAEIKKAVTGRGQATKEQVAHMVSVLLDPACRAQLQAERAPERDATDALAVAIAATHRLSRVETIAPPRAAGSPVSAPPRT
jgi:crossover junction endodeoxyribonuclease RuvC